MQYVLHSKSRMWSVFFEHFRLKVTKFITKYGNWHMFTFSIFKKPTETSITFARNLLQHFSGSRREFQQFAEPWLPCRCPSLDIGNICLDPLCKSPDMHSATRHRQLDAIFPMTSYLYLWNLFWLLEIAAEIKRETETLGTESFQVFYTVISKFWNLEMFQFFRSAGSFYLRTF